MTIEIRHGDCLSVLKNMEDCSVNTCVTSPPYYAMRSYLDEKDPLKKFEIGHEETPAKYIEKLVSVFDEVKRVLKDDGTLWLNLGDCFYNYRPGKGQSLVKQTISSTLRDMPQTCPRRANKIEGLKEKDLIGIPWMAAFALRDAGWYLRSDIIWDKINPTPESVRDRPTRAHEYIFLLAKSQSYYYDYESIREDGKAGGKKNKLSIWPISNKGGGEHFATFPRELISPCILAGCPKGGIVLDPFGGSGTVAEEAEWLGRNSVIIELNKKYIEIAKKRTAQKNLF